MYPVDSGGSLGIYGVDPVNGGLQWSAVGLDGATAELPRDFPWPEPQLLEPPGSQIREPRWPGALVHR